MPYLNAIDNDRRVAELLRQIPAKMIRQNHCVLPFVIAILLAGMFARDGRAQTLSNLPDSTVSPTESADGMPDRRSGSQRLPIPAVEARRESAAKIREIFGIAVSKASPPEVKAKLAAELISNAAGTDTPVDRYVLLDGAQSLAIDAGDIDLVFAAIDQQAQWFQVNPAQAKADALDKLSTKAPIGSLAKVIDALLATAAEHLDRDLATAETLTESAIAAARRAKDRDRQKTGLSQLADIRERTKLRSQAKPLEERLAADPSDRKTVTDLGRFRCFVEDRWEDGLPLLARGTDAELALLANGEAADLQSPANRLALADRWWEYADSHKGGEAAAAEGRARMHYGIVLNELTGLERARVQKRLEAPSAAAGKNSAAKRPKGLVLWLDASAPGALRGPDGVVLEKSGGAGLAVSAWGDVQGGRGVARQTDLARLPSAKPNAFGRRTGVQFSGGQWLTTDVAPPPQGTLAMVSRPTSIASHMRILGCYTKSAGIRLGARTDGEVWLELVNGDDSPDINRSAAGLMRTNEPLLITATWPQPNLLRVGGRSFEKQQSPQWKPGTAAYVVIGAMNQQGHEAFNGVFGEVRLYDRILTAAELVSLEGELSAKWPGGR